MFRMICAGSVLSIILLISSIPNAYGGIVATRFQSKTVPQECLGGSGKDSKVGLWSCSEKTTRYNWEIVETFNPEIFYIRNIARRHRCLGSKSDNQKLRYYPGDQGECREISLERWRIKDENGKNYTKDDVRNGMIDKTVRLVNEQNGKCITEISKKARLRPCNGSQGQLFKIIETKEVVDPPRPPRPPIKEP